MIESAQMNGTEAVAKSDTFMCKIGRYFNEHPIRFGDKILSNPVLIHVVALAASPSTCSQFLREAHKINL